MRWSLSPLCTPLSMDQENGATCSINSMPPRVFLSRRRRCASLAIPMHRGSTSATDPSLAFLWNRWSSSHKENILLMSAASVSRETEIGERLTPSLTTTKIECDYGGDGLIFSLLKQKKGKSALSLKYNMSFFISDSRSVF